MSCNYDIQKLIELHKLAIYEDKRRLGLLKDSTVQLDEVDDEHQTASPDTKIKLLEDKLEEEKENLQTLSKLVSSNRPNHDNQSFPLVERLDLSYSNGSLEEKKQAFIDKIANAENPLTFRSNDSGCAMLRYGEYSPNNPQLRVAAVPYLGLGEYEQRRQLILNKQRADYKEHLSRQNEIIKNKARSFFLENKSFNTGLCKAVQTDIQNIHNKLVQYEYLSHNPAEKELSPQEVIAENEIMHNHRSSSLNRVDQRLTSVQNAYLTTDMNKPKSILSSRRTESPRERLMADLRHSYVPSFLDGFNYDKTDHVERERLKREAYQNELRQQIEEKKRLALLQEEHERRELELENRRFEQQLLKLQEDQLREEQRRYYGDEQRRRNSEDLIRRQHELQDRAYRKHAESESSVTGLRNTIVASKHLSQYSPPVSRRPPYSFNVPSSSVFSNPTNRTESLNRHEPRIRSNSLNRHESLSRIDSLNRQDSLSRLDSLSIDDTDRAQRRHSATHHEVTYMRSPRSQRSASTSKFDDALPIPILKAHSPVAKDLKNAIAINSSRRSADALRKLEDKWQIPAVQKNIITHGDPSREGHGRSILTQLGSIRMQLQKEQLRMDETLRKRGISQPKAV